MTCVALCPPSFFFSLIISNVFNIILNTLYNYLLQGTLSPSSTPEHRSTASGELCAFTNNRPQNPQRYPLTYRASQGPESTDATSIHTATSAKGALALVPIIILAAQNTRRFQLGMWATFLIISWLVSMASAASFSSTTWLNFPAPKASSVAPSSFIWESMTAAFTRTTATQRATSHSSP